MAETNMKVELAPLSRFRGLPRNPKDHDLGAIAASLRRFGFVDPIVVNGETGHILSGHGRVGALRAMKAQGVPAPSGIQDGGGEWLVPVVEVAVPEDQEEAASIALNRTVELGGWDEGVLATVLSDLAAAGELEGSGYTAEELDGLLALAGGMACYGETAMDRDGQGVSSTWGQVKATDNCRVVIGDLETRLQPALAERLRVYLTSTYQNGRVPIHDSLAAVVNAGLGVCENRGD